MSILSRLLRRSASIAALRASYIETSPLPSNIASSPTALAAISSLVSRMAADLSSALSSPRATSHRELTTNIATEAIWAV